MNQTLAKYHSRAPRYILQPQDNTVIRMSGPMQVPWEEGTELKNISLTGLAFTVPSDISPSIGEFIKIEYSVPGGSQSIACYSLVVRLEDIASGKTLVGIKFFRMELAQRVILAQGLALKMRDQQIHSLQEKQQSMNRPSRIIPFLFLGLWSVLFYFACSWIWMQYLNAAN